MVVSISITGISEGEEGISLGGDGLKDKDRERETKS